MYVIATSRPLYEYMSQKLSNLTGREFLLINNKDDLTLEMLQSIKPRYIFFPHWSFLIPNEVYENFECIILHMTDVPFGRGGSPLQNLISRGIYETKISALRCQDELDAGPVYIKRPLSLFGTGEEIFIRAAKIIEEIILTIIDEEITPIEQHGEIVRYKRRRPQDGNIANLQHLEQVFDYIRMLDADGYPKAFLETEFFRFEFDRASLKNGFLISDVKIIRKQDET